MLAVLIPVLSFPWDEIPVITFTVPFPYQLAGSAATVVGYVLGRQIIRLLLGRG